MLGVSQLWVTLWALDQSPASPGKGPEAEELVVESGGAGWLKP